MQTGVSSCNADCRRGRGSSESSCLLPRMVGVLQMCGEPLHVALHAHRLLNGSSHRVCGGRCTCEEHTVHQVSSATCSRHTRYPCMATHAAVTLSILTTLTVVPGYLLAANIYASVRPFLMGPFEAPLVGTPGIDISHSAARHEDVVRPRQIRPSLVECASRMCYSTQTASRTKPRTQAPQTRRWLYTFDEVVGCTHPQNASTMLG